MAFRLRCKVYEKEGRSYLIGAAIIREPHGLIKAIAMSDEHTLLLDLSIDEYNALAYHYFDDQGPAPKAEAVRPMVIGL